MDATHRSGARFDEHSSQNEAYQPNTYPCRLDNAYERKCPRFSSAVEFPSTPRLSRINRNRTGPAIRLYERLPSSEPSCQSQSFHSNWWTRRASGLRYRKKSVRKRHLDSPKCRDCSDRWPSSYAACSRDAQTPWVRPNYFEECVQNRLLREPVDDHWVWHDGVYQHTIPGTDWFPATKARDRNSVEHPLRCLIATWLRSQWRPTSTHEHCLRSKYWDKSRAPNHLKAENRF